MIMYFIVAVVWLIVGLVLAAIVDGVFDGRMLSSDRDARNFAIVAMWPAGIALLPCVLFAWGVIKLVRGLSHMLFGPHSRDLND
jgi:hypothetical protein